MGLARRGITASLPLLAAAALLAGCGSSSSSSGSSAATSQTSSTATGTTPTGSTATTPTTSTGTSTSSKLPGAAAAVASCRHGVQSLPRLKQSTKERLETICEKATSGDVNAKREAAEEACRELVNASPLPAGEAKNRALAACKDAARARAKGSIGK
jgi:hypothetical protein